MSTDPAVSPTPEPRWLVECDLGIDCAEAGRCYAVSNGRPDMCPTAEHGGVVFGSWTTDKGSRFLTAAASSSSPTPEPRLGMGELLIAVADHKLDAWEHLTQKHHPGSVMAKFEKAARKGYTDYGTTPRMAWLTDKGIAYLITSRDGWCPPEPKGATS